ELFLRFRAVRAELGAAEAEAEAATQRMEGLFQEKKIATQEASECSEDAKRWRASAAEAEEREAEWAPGKEPEVAPTFEKLQKAILAGEKATAEPRPQECWQRHESAVERMKAAHGKVLNLDEGLRALSQSMPTQLQAVEACKKRAAELEAQVLLVRQSRAAVLGIWDQAIALDRSCGVGLRGLEGLLGEAHGSLEDERTRRCAMRRAIRELVESLTSLDGHLSALESDEARLRTVEQPSERNSESSM
ncbi:unnamed protein product, partial [Polarella glacialis]